jgi:hypothetical protein
MVYGQQPQQYQVPNPQGYGQPPAQQYGAPAQPVGAPPPEIKWSGLSTGGAFKVPVIAFLGRLVDMVEDYGSQYGLRIVEKYDQVQILESPVPWPWATIDLSVKYSDREQSGWGYHVASAKAIGLAQNATSLAQAKADLVGKVYEMRQADQSYGENQQGQAMHGDVWRFIRIVQPGMVQSFPQPQYAQPTATTQPTAQPQSQPSGGVAPTPAAPIPQAQTPQQPATTGLNLTLDPADTPAVRAKKLLHGKALNEWLGAALMDDKIKADSAFINSIYDQSFIVGLKASGQVTQSPDGRFVVVA